MALDTTTEKLVGLARSLRYEDLTPAAIRAAKARIVSTIAVSLAAYDMEPVRIARKLAQTVAAGPAARIFGALTATTPDMAAFVNAAMVRCLDMSDSYVMEAVSHPADAFPAILAVAEAENKSGRELLLATALIYEVQCRFVEVVPYNQYGWDQTPVVALGAAIGCARLLGLSDAQTANAISIAVVPNIALNQTRTGNLSMWKGMAGPQGARAGVFAAYLAREGMTGPDGAFEGRFGFWQQLMHGKTFELPIPTDFRTHTFAVQQTMIKSFPTRFNCQVPVFTAQKLHKKIALDEIASITIESIRQAFARWMDVPEIWKPETRETADHSLPCTVAMAMIDGTVTPAMMERRRFKDADVLALMAKCRIELPDEFAELAPATRCCRITVRMKNGEIIVAETRRSLADEVIDPGWTQAKDKFSALTASLLDAATRKSLLAWVETMERQREVRDLLDLTQL